MRLAVVHYHLRPGGVTQVIEQTVEALQARGVRVAVLTGEPGPSKTLAPLTVHDPMLGYADASAARWPDPDLDRLRAAATSRLGGAPDIWHLHNHSLGKNAVLPRLAAALAKRAEPLLLQVHDFAEDGRPKNYRALAGALGDGGRGALYPLGPRVGYALLNRRDRDLVRDSGAPADACVLLPNPVRPWAATPLPPGGELPLLLYPTRAIRRKNVGEVLLWAAWLRGRARFATTLAPANPEARSVYDRWVALARELDLPVAFGVGEGGAPFGDVVRTARAAITTSVAEGFGLAFLEPWGAGRPLVGRNLPEITGDFAEAGVQLDTLYSRLDIPAEWVDGAELERRVTESLRRARLAYGLPCTDDDTARALAAVRGPGGMDFGRLDETLQEAVIRRIARSGAARKDWQPPADPLAAMDRQEREGHVETNARATARAFSLDGYGDRLLQIYQRLLAAPPDRTGFLDPDRLLQAFAAPERFRLLRT